MVGSPGELGTVHVLVTLLANPGRGSEIHIPQCHFHVGRTMATGTGRSPMRAGQRITRVVMVEADEIFPGLLRVAGFASLGNTSGSQCLCHLQFELPTVNIGVTGRTVQAFEVVRNPGILRFFLLWRFVTVDTSDSQMTPRQRESQLLMPGKGKCRRLKSKFGVAVVAAITMRCGGELLLVSVLVAVGAAIELDFVPRSPALRYMALGAGDHGVFAAQGKGSQIVLYQEEFGRLEPFDGMAAFAFSSIGTGCELAVVWIGLVAIGALRERNRRLEISLDVALETADLRMLSQQGILCCGVVELPFQRNLFP